MQFVTLIIGSHVSKLNPVLCFGYSTFSCLNFFLKFFLPNCTLVSMVSSTTASCEVIKVCFHLKRCERGCEVFQATSSGPKHTTWCYLSHFQQQFDDQTHASFDRFSNRQNLATVFYKSTRPVSVSRFSVPLIYISFH